MYKIEAELIGGDSFFMKRDGQVVEFADVTDADVSAEKLYRMKSGGGLYARFSVVDDDGNRVTDWEC